MHQNCGCSKTKLSQNQAGYLKKLGLSKEAIRLYDLLLSISPLTAEAAAAHSQNFPSAYYRLFYELEQRQLVRRHAGRPRSWSALPLTVGLQSAFQGTEAELQTLLRKSLKSTGTSDNTQLIIGRQGVYDAYAQYAPQAKNEVLIYSIGIAYSETLESTQKSLIKRGVRIRHIMQRYQPANYFIAHKWLRAGVKLRHLPRPQGFHFFIIDDKRVCLTFTDAQDADNRFSIMTDNKPAISLFLTQFDQLWQEAGSLALD